MNGGWTSNKARARFSDLAIIHNHAQLKGVISHTKNPIHVSVSQVRYFH